jgi:hypothetical protein
MYQAPQAPMIHFTLENDQAFATKLTTLVKEMPWYADIQIVQSDTDTNSYITITLLHEYNHPPIQTLATRTGNAQTVKLSELNKNWDTPDHLIEKISSVLSEFLQIEPSEPTQPIVPYNP